jgi:ubiquitin-like 1-activating enzyme E1 B
MNQLADKKVLVVGAGGIGCELLKNLVMTGFKTISIVDLDKIEKSNLNRQFLYTPECIGKYKSEMAKAALEKKKKDLKLTSYVGNIKDLSMFDHDFFKEFDIILNALDNIDARTYINKICVDYNIPLVNSGTEGYVGVVSCHVKGISSCYNCIPRSNNKKYPVCSIRGKPEKIEHCVAWAKELFELIYCQDSSGNLLEDYNIHNIDHLAFEKLFSTEIIEGVPINEIISGDINYDDFNKRLHEYDDKDDITLENLICIFFTAGDRLEKNVYEKFDKEDKDIVNFVYAASNLRAYNFSIKRESRFRIKEIAGNIIPAIASTNAIIAAIQTIEAVKVLQGENKFRNVSLTKEQKIVSTYSYQEAINKECAVCSEDKHLSTLEINFSIYTVSDFISLLKNEFKIEGFMITLKNDIIYDDEEVEDYEMNKIFYDFTKDNICKLNVLKGDDNLAFLLCHNPDRSNNDYKLVKVNEYEKAAETEVDENDQKMKDVNLPDVVELTDDDLEIIEPQPKLEFKPEPEISKETNYCFLGKKRKLEYEFAAVKKMKYD